MTVLDSGGRFGSAGRAKRTRRLIAWGLVAALAAGGAWAVWFSTVLLPAGFRMACRLLKLGLRLK